MDQDDIICVMNLALEEDLSDDKIEELLSDLCMNTKRIVTIEDGVLEGGFGSAVLEFIEKTSIKGVKVRRIGLPDKFIEHGRRDELFSKYNLTPEAICDVIINEVIR